MYSKKLKLLISPTCVTSGEIRNALGSKYDLIYCGIYSHNDEVSVYIQNKTKMARSVVEKLLTDTLDIRDITVFSKVEGTPLCQTGTIPKHGGKRVSIRPRSHAAHTAPTNITNNNTDNSVNTNNNADQRVAINNFFPVALNPMGKETIDHITSDSMAACYDNPMSNRVVTSFSDLLYDVNENLNIRCSSKDSTCKGFTEQGWISVRKDTGYDIMYNNLSEKSIQVMNKFREDLSDDMVRKHEREVREMEQGQRDMEKAGHTKYLKNRNNTLNLVGENISNRIKDFHTKNGKRLKFT